MGSLLGSTTAFDRPGEGCARPKIVRGYRPEPSDDETGLELFSDDEAEAGKQSVKQRFSPTFRQPKYGGPAVREISKRRIYDGSEMTFVSVDTQTDWTMLLDDKPRSPIGMDVELEKTVTKRKWQRVKTYEDEDLAAIYRAQGMGFKKKVKEGVRRCLSTIEDEVDEEQLEEEQGIAKMFNGICEFCHKQVLPFPTLDQQLQFPPEMLYCCSTYQDFVEFVLNSVTELEEEEKEKNKFICVKVHKHVGSKEARDAAKEQASQRMKDRREPNPIGAVAGGGLMFNYKALYKMGPLTMKDMFAARQTKMVNYMLSSDQFLENGWTSKSPAPLCKDELEKDVFEPEPLDPAMAASAKLRKLPLIEKFYETGQKFLTMFPDGTGNVFYPSGNLAILISSVKPSQYNYTISHLDPNKAGVAANFVSNGYGSAYYPNGNLRIYIDQYGGVELAHNGGKKRKWLWKDLESKSHTSHPIQPICLRLNQYLAVRMMSQEKIILTFTANKRRCRFNMGSKLKLVAPGNAPLKEIQEDQIFLEEKKTDVGTLLDKVSTLLKYPNSPRIDKILPPLYVTNKITKTEKLKEEHKSRRPQLSARDEKSSPVSPGTIPASSTITTL